MLVDQRFVLVVWERHGKRQDKPYTKMNEVKLEYLRPLQEEHYRYLGT